MSNMSGDGSAVQATGRGNRFPFCSPAITRWSCSLAAWSRNCRTCTQKNHFSILAHWRQTIDLLLTDFAVDLLPRELPSLLEPLDAAGEDPAVVAVLPDKQAVLKRKSRKKYLNVFCLILIF